MSNKTIVLLLALLFVVASGKFLQHDVETDYDSASPSSGAQYKRFCVSKEIYKRDCDFDALDVSPNVMSGITKAHKGTKSAADYWK